MITVSAFWGDRPDDQRETASRLANCLERLGSVDPVLSHWRLKGGSRTAAAANAVLPLDAQALAAHLKIRRRDIGGEPMPELGFSFAAWNGGHVGDDAAFSCTVGLHASNPNLRNSVVVDLPTGWAERSARVDAVAQVLREMWEPDEIVLFGTGSSRRTLWTRSGSEQV